LADPLTSTISPLLLLGQADAAAAAQHSLLGYLKDGGPVGAVIVLLSVLAVGLMIANMIILRKERLAPPDVVDRLREMFRENDIETAQAYCKAEENQCFLTRMFAASLRRCERSAFGFLELRSALEEAGQREIDRLQRITDGIALLAGLGPMMGLLGTVIGMIGAFRTLGALEGAQRSQELATWMSVALVTTAEGLVLAIPCTIAYSFFRRRIDRLVGEVSDIAEELSSFVQQSASRGAARPTAGVIGAARPGPAAPSASGGPVRGAAAS
jgi:biopolymer transport protein ExbB